MSLWLRQLLLVLVVLLCLLVRVPATWLDVFLARTSQGAVRLADAEGTIWQGHAVVLVQGAQPQARIWQSLHWRADWSDWWRATLGWQFFSGQFEQAAEKNLGSNTNIATFKVSPGGWALQQVKLSAAAELVMESLPHFLTQAGGWRGQLDAQSESWQCDWQQLCQGQAVVLWRQVASSYLPGVVYGDYQARLTSSSAGIAVDISTLKGRLQIQGQGRLSASGSLAGRFVLSGDPELTERLSAIAGDSNLKPGKAPGEWVLEIGASS